MCLARVQVNQIFVVKLSDNAEFLCLRVKIVSDINLSTMLKPVKGILSSVKCLNNYHVFMLVIQQNNNLPKHLLKVGVMRVINGGI